ncbi:hypothetical protein DVK44_17740 [Streptomyces paludis]|uniref:Uncharacterized protein n=1 Tax=Streptomyces paludis TaxID=2282738 RepID=A0A345HR74_9ACTN|nr:hypothetical protein DVK44_17740 [Streptomyces paludis]
MAWPRKRTRASRRGGAAPHCATPSASAPCCSAARCCWARAPVWRTYGGRRPTSARSARRSPARRRRGPGPTACARCPRPSNVR